MSKKTKVKVGKKKQSSLDMHDLSSKLKTTFRRFSWTAAILVIPIILIFAILNLMNIVENTSEVDQNMSNSAMFDQDTIRRLEEVKSSSSQQLDIPAGRRINPFVE